MHRCEIRDCRAPLRGFDYWALELRATASDRARTVAVCRCCKRKIDRARRDAGAKGD